MVTKPYNVQSCIICVRCTGRMFKVDDSYGEYFECLACGHTVDIKLNPAYVPQQRTCEISNPFYLTNSKGLIYGDRLLKSDVMGEQ
jgi:hypothetical protein